MNTYTYSGSHIALLETQVEHALTKLRAHLDYLQQEVHALASRKSYRAWGFTIDSTAQSREKIASTNNEITLCNDWIGWLTDLQRCLSTHPDSVTLDEPTVCTMAEFGEKATDPAAQS